MSTALEIASGNLPDIIADQYQRALSLLTRAAGERCTACGTLAAIAAFGALEQALTALQAQGYFPMHAATLKKRMSLSASCGLPWLDYPRLRQAVTRRNLAAHGRALLELRESRDYVALIGAQLEVWQRAMVAAKLATLARGSNQHSSIDGPSRDEAASLLNVSTASVDRAKQVIESCAPAIQQLVESV